MRYDGVMDERDFFTERPEQKPVQYTCPRCKRRNEYQVRWMRRTKKDRLPPGADARDRALYAKLKDYLIRMDEGAPGKAWQQRFEIPSYQSMVFVGSMGGGGSAGPRGDDDDDNRGNRA